MMTRRRTCCSWWLGRGRMRWCRSAYERHRQTDWKEGGQAEQRRREGRRLRHPLLLVVVRLPTSPMVWVARTWLLTRTTRFGWQVEYVRPSGLVKLCDVECACVRSCVLSPLFVSSCSCCWRWCRRVELGGWKRAMGMGATENWPMRRLNQKNAYNKRRNNVTRTGTTHTYSVGHTLYHTFVPVVVPRLFPLDSLGSSQSCARSSHERFSQPNRSEQQREERRFE